MNDLIAFISLLLMLLGGFVLGCIIITKVYLRMGALDWATVKIRQWNAIETEQDKANAKRGHARNRKF